MDFYDDDDDEIDPAWGDTKRLQRREDCSLCVIPAVLYDDAPKRKPTPCPYSLLVDARQDVSADYYVQAFLVERAEGVREAVYAGYATRAEVLAAEIRDDMKCPAHCVPVSRLHEMDGLLGLLGPAAAPDLADDDAVPADDFDWLNGDDSVADDDDRMAAKLAALGSPAFSPSLAIDISWLN